MATQVIRAMVSDFYSTSLLDTPDRPHQHRGRPLSPLSADHDSKRTTTPTAAITNDHPSFSPPGSSYRSPSPSPSHALSTPTSPPRARIDKGKAKAQNPSYLSRILFGRFLKDPKILAHFLRASSWRDFQALSSSCREFRYLIHTPECRDAILSHYVPGYRYVLDVADIVPQQELAIDIEFHDLALLSESLPISSRVPGRE